ncbi:unnamed protein product [Cunninghamella blakesleeana]
MIQTTLFNYFKCNGAIKPTGSILQSFKQTNLTDYNFNIMSKKKKKKSIEPKRYSILNYFKSIEEQKQVDKKAFDLILVDIRNSKLFDIKCVKKNMYDEELKYICISYRWGELNEQLVKTPDYTAHITSFVLADLKQLCHSISHDPDLKEIRYLWIDAISVDQQHHSRKKETILKMNQIYKKASYIIAVPDLHMEYLWKNPANWEVLKLLSNYREKICKEIHSCQQHCHAFIENKEKEETNDDMKKIYKYLAYLIDDWSNRAWVISEYHIAKDKYKKHGTPLKYIFITLLSNSFFSYYFDDDDDDDEQQTQQQHYTTINNEKIIYKEVDNPKLFIRFLKSRFMQRSYFDMILNSNATRNEDRFNAILPSWDKYSHVIKNKYTVSRWDITDMTSVRLKLYEMMDDLWDKARLLYTCSRIIIGDNFILPSFASYDNMDFQKLVEIDDMNAAYDKYGQRLLNDIPNEKEKDRIQQLINEYKMNFKPIWTENLTSIQLNHHHHYLSVKPITYFIFEIQDKWKKRSTLLGYPLKIDYQDCLYYVHIPFFTFTIPDYINIPPFITGINLIGNVDKNEWCMKIKKFACFR